MLQKIAQNYQLSTLRVARNYGNVRRFIGNPYYPKDAKDSYGSQVLRVGRSIDEFDLNRRVYLESSNDAVLEKLDPHEAKQLALIKYAPAAIGGLYILPSFIETNEEKNQFYEELKRKIARFVFTFALIEEMTAQINQTKPIFSSWAQNLQTKALTMNYEDFANYLVDDFFKEYPKPIDYVKAYMHKTGETNLLKLVDYSLVEEIVNEELMSRYKQLEQYETPEAALVNLLDSILSDDEFISQAPQGARRHQVEKSIHDVKDDREGYTFVESVANRLHLRESKMPQTCRGNSFFAEIVRTLKDDTLEKFHEATGIRV